MAAQGDEVISAANLAAALGAEASDADTSGKPVSAANLKAVLDHVAGETLFHGVGTEESVQLSKSVTGFDYALVCFYATWNGERQLDYVGSCPASTVTGGGQMGLTVMSDNSGGFYPGTGSFEVGAEPSGTRLTLVPSGTTHHYYITDVAGVRTQG